ncbi:WD repeat-containing protein wdr-5.2-like [Scyliorhinus canicula]|uniref:WD repeat-containing protein wdr-5.2-like n=1 Tax=Scyliorhinus canicula TaxID=7830 RepID=UPI0018F43922|nr:WD repeat-containing protein wdr-5.2-like [Scyliorhinus canicula]
MCLTLPSLPAVLSQLLNAETGIVAAKLCPGHRTRQAVTAMNYYPHHLNLLVTAGADGIITVFNTDTGWEAVEIKEEDNEIHALDFCSDGSVYGTAGRDRHIRLYDSRTSKILKVFEAPDFTNGDNLTLMSGHSRRIFALRFHPDECHVFLTGGWDNSIKIWDKRMEKEARRLISGPHICGHGIDIRNNRILTGSWVAHNALKLWDYRSLRLEKTIPFPLQKGQSEFLYTAQFCNNEVVIAGGSGTHSAHAINYKTNQDLGEITLHRHSVQAVDTVLHGQLIAVAGVSGNLHIAALC